MNTKAFRTVIPLVFAGAVGVMTAGAANVVTDFSYTNNPAGPWSYYYGTSATTQTLYTSSQGYASCPSVGLPCWVTSNPQPDFLQIVQNTSGSAVSQWGSVILPNNMIRLDPEQYTVSIVYTAASSGVYNVAGNFLGIDVNQNAHPVQILYDGTVVYSNTISSYGQDDPFNFSQHLNAGDTLSFTVETGSTGCSYCNLSTGLDGTVTMASAPEPAPAALLLGSAGVYAFVSRRKTR